MYASDLEGKDLVCEFEENDTVHASVVLHESHPTTQFVYACLLGAWLECSFPCIEARMGSRVIVS